MKALVILLRPYKYSSWPCPDPSSFSWAGIRYGAILGHVLEGFGLKWRMLVSLGLQGSAKVSVAKEIQPSRCPEILNLPQSSILRPIPSSAGASTEYSKTAGSFRLTSCKALPLNLQLFKTKFVERTCISLSCEISLETLSQ